MEEHCTQGPGQGGGNLTEKVGHGGWSLVGLVNSMVVTDLFLCASLSGHSGALTPVGSLEAVRQACWKVSGRKAGLLGEAVLNPLMVS